jgi:hypothetical protein
MLLRLLTLLAAASFTFAAAPTQWEWVQPTPHRQGWRDLAPGPDALIGITDGLGRRDIYRSADGQTWERVAAPRTRGLLKVMYANGSYVAVGKSATILTSTDGVDWQLRLQNDLQGDLWDVAYGAGKFIAVGYNRIAYSSTNLKDWKKVSLDDTVNQIEFANGVFVGWSSTQLLRSTDGENWTAAPLPENVPALTAYDRLYTGLTVFNGKFFAASANGVASSTDGVTWTSLSNRDCRQVISTPDALYAVGYSFHASLDRSTDGINWTRVIDILPTAQGPFIQSVASFKGRTIAVGDPNLYLESTDGATWTQLSKPIDYSRSSIASGQGLFIHYGAEDGNFISPDGETWEFNPAAPALETLAHGNNTWVGITPDNEAAISQDGITWTLNSLPSQASGSILFANNKFLAATDGGVLVSPNGTAWQRVTIPNAQSIRLIGFQNGLFCAMTDTSAPATSPDGITWTVHPAQPDIQAHHYAAGNGRFVGIAGFDMGMAYVTSSTDGILWQRNALTTGSTHVFTSLTFADSFFVMTDNNGGIYYSADGITWNGRTEAPQQFTGTAYGNGAWIAIGGDSILRATAQFTAKSAANLQLVQSTANTWNLVVTGSPGEKWQIQSAANCVSSQWSNTQLVEIPVTGKVTLPMSAANASLFFRAIVSAP